MEGMCPDSNIDDIKLTWEDLIVDRVTEAEAAAWLADWQWLGLGRIAPVFLSRFGNWFFLRPDGAVHMLHVCEAVVELVAPDFDKFQALVNTQEGQEKCLYSALVLQFRRQGIVARGRDAIGFAPHPAFVSSLDACKVMVLTMNVWQAICGQAMRQIRGAAQSAASAGNSGDTSPR